MAALCAAMSPAAIISLHLVFPPGPRSPPVVCHSIPLVPADSSRGRQSNYEIVALYGLRRGPWGGFVPASAEKRRGENPRRGDKASLHDQLETCLAVVAP